MLLLENRNLPDRSRNFSVVTKIPNRHMYSILVAPLSGINHAPLKAENSSSVSLCLNQSHSTLLLSAIVGSLLNKQNVKYTTRGKYLPAD